VTAPVIPFPPRAGAPAGDPEAELVARARAGDAAAFERLYRAHAGRVHAVCLRLLADRGRAEEATQDAFVRAWRRLGSFRGESAFGSWLYRLAANVALDLLRSERRRAGGLADWDAEGEDPDGAPARDLPEPPSARRQPGAALDLERAIRTLPPRARAVFVLHDLEGYRHGEIAGLAGIAEGTSKAQLHRARKLLREILQ
jgi:RNA polymerase sigma-70 factor (ECF subfamily)